MIVNFLLRYPPTAKLSDVVGALKMQVGLRSAQPDRICVLGEAHSDVLVERFLSLLSWRRHVRNP